MITTAENSAAKNSEIGGASRKWVHFSGGESSAAGADESPSTTANNDDVAQIDVKMEEISMASGGAGGKIADGFSLTSNSNGFSTAAAAGKRAPPLPNGKIVTTIFPVNKICPWITCAIFDPYKMPKSLISDSLTMPVETYVEVMEKLTNDFRFRIYTALYRRLIVFWFIFCLFVLLMLLLSGLKGITLFSIVLLWLFLTGVGVLLVLHVKRILNRNLHKCVASVNKLLIKYNLMIGIEDRGKLSCHKIALIFVYFDWKSCAQKISIMSHNFQRNNARNSGLPSLSAQISPPGDTLQYGGNLSEEEKSLLLICKCSQGYVKGLSRKILRLPSTPRTPGADARQTPLHCTHSQCLCQYVQSSYFEKVRRSAVQRIFLTDGVDWSASYYVDPGFHPGILP